MNTNSIFTVNIDDLSKLDQNTSVDFFRKLLWAEARRLGIELSKINVSSWVNVPDGGVDASVDGIQINAGIGIIKQGKTCYQIKSGVGFKPWQKSVIKKELFGSKTPKRENLGESIQDCLDVDGAYVLVCTGIDPVETQLSLIQSHILEYLKQCGYSNPKIEVFTQNILIGFLESFPSLSLRVNRKDGGDFQTHRSWSQDATMRAKFFSDETIQNHITDIREELRRNNDTIHIRILGEPGIGKTKLALEATKVEDLSPLVIYTTASQFLNDSLLNEIIKEDNSYSVILVIDECNQDNRSFIWNKLKYRGPRIKLITIYNEYEEKATGISYFDSPILNNEQIASIIQSYITVPKNDVNKWTELCSGSPRVAHVIGENLVNNPDDLLRSPGTVDIWERYIVAGEDPNSEKINQQRLVLQHLALFKRFGYERSVAIESEAIQKMVQQADNQITPYKFKEIISQLRDRKILQGDFTLYITPKALHIKLWTQWWEINYPTFNHEDFIQDLGEELIRYFYDMFVYAAESDAALRVVKQLLGSEGPFHENDYLNTKLGSAFFLSLVEASPDQALKLLMRTIGTCNKRELFHFVEGRRNVVWALEKIAKHQDLFQDAARLLLALGEAENERISNNASGVFSELFSLGPGAVAPTEASPMERFDVLLEAFESDSKERRKLALDACRIGLKSEHFSRISGAEYQGIRREPNLWNPKTYGEWWDAFRSLWDLLFNQVSLLKGGERDEAVSILLGWSGSIARIPNLGDLVVDTIRAIKDGNYTSEKHLIQTINRILFHDDSYIEGKGLPKKIRQSFEKLKDDLIGNDFHSLMQRYVGMDLLEDEVIKGREKVDPVNSYHKKLAIESIENPSLLKDEMSWLVTPDAKNGMKFGYELGIIDENLSLLPMLLDAQRNVVDNTSTYFLGGYFNAIFERDLPIWEQQLDSLCEDPILKKIVPSLTHYSGLTDKAGIRILNLAENGIIEIQEFDFFTYKNSICSLSEKVFHTWIEFLMVDTNRSAIDIALKLFYNYYISRNPDLTLPSELTFRLLSHRNLYMESENYKYDTMSDFYWTEIATSLLKVEPITALQLVPLMLVPFGNDDTIFDSFSQSCSFLTEATKQYPHEVWNYVNPYLGNYDNFTRTLSLANWLSEGDISETEKEKGALTLIPMEIIWEWVDIDVENRMKYLAHEFVPNVLKVEDWNESLVRGLLIRYGNRKDVREILIVNYQSESFWGPRSLHYEEKLQKLLEIKNIDDNKNVNQWINEFVDWLHEAIQEAKLQEERQVS